MACLEDKLELNYWVKQEIRNTGNSWEAIKNNPTQSHITSKYRSGPDTAIAPLNNKRLCIVSMEILSHPDSTDCKQHIKVFINFPWKKNKHIIALLQMMQGNSHNDYIFTAGHAWCFTEDTYGWHT